MCFGGKTPAPKAPPPPPTERDANLEGLRDRQRAAAASKTSGNEATLLTGPGGDQSAAPVYKSKLGG